jgi:hypothetical protein
MRVLFLMRWAQEDRMLAASIALATIMVGSMSALLCLCEVRRRRRRRSLVHGLLPKNSEKSVPKPKLIY